MLEFRQLEEEEEEEQEQEEQVLCKRWTERIEPTNICSFSLLLVPSVSLPKQLNNE